MSSTQAKSVVEVTIDSGRMRAWLQPAKEVASDEINHEGIQSALESAGIAINDQVAARIDDYLKQIDTEARPPEKFLIAQGRDPEEPKDGSFEWAPESSEPTTDPEEELHFDFHDINTIRSIEKDAVIGKIIAPEKGTDGLDVLGNPIKAKRSASTIEVGPNVRLLDDGTVVSETYGRVVLKYDQLSVEEILEISGDVDFECGNLDVPCDIHIRGTVLDSFEVKSKKSITIGGRVRAAQLEAGMDVVIRGGILGGEKGKVTADGSISTRFCEDADLQARGDIMIASDAVNCKLFTESQLVADRATIIGGAVHARKGVTVAVLGSEAEVPTPITVGIQAERKKQTDPNTSEDLVAKQQQEKISAESNKIEKLESVVKKIRQSLQPAMDHPDRLSEDHRKQATHLLERADKIEAEIKHRLKIQEELSKVGPPLGSADVIINKVVYPKVVLTIDDRQSRFIKPLKGPVRIEKRKLKNVSELVAVNLLTGSVTRLQSERKS